MSELDDIEYSEDMPAPTPATDETVGPDNATDNPVNTPPDDKQTTIQPISTIQPCADTPSPSKIESKPSVEQRKPRYKRKSQGMRQIQANSSKQAQSETKAGKPRNTGNRDLTLNLKQSNFISYLTDPTSETYGNQTKSYLRAYGNESYMGAAVNASVCLKTPKIATWIDNILEKAKANTQARVAILADVMHNRTIRTIKRQAATKDGVVDLVDTYEPTAQERIKAIDTLNKLSGDYDTAKRASAQAEAEYKSLLKHTGFPQAKAMQERAEDAETVAEGEGEKTTGEGD